MKVEAITKDIIMLVFKNKHTAARAMIRPQEFYESPMDEIRNNTFTLGKLRELYANSPERSGSSGVFSYFSGNTFDGDWSGFNIPSYALRPFIKGTFDPLTPHEEDMVMLFRDKLEPYYIIGVYEKEDGSKHAIDHEISHALFYVNKEYKAEIQAALKESNQQELIRAVKDFLISWGYSETVIEDEFHAYCGVDYDWFKDKIKDEKNIDIGPLKGLHKEMVHIRNKHYVVKE